MVLPESVEDNVRLNPVVKKPDCCEKTGEFKKLEYPTFEFIVFGVGEPK